MSTKNKRKYNLKSSLLLLLLTAILLIATSYAWFTSNTTVAIESLQVNVEAKNGLQISADGLEWKTIVQTNDLKTVPTTTYTAAKNQLPTVLEPVSTAGTIDTSTGFMDMYYGVVGSDDAGNYTLTTPDAKETEANGTTGKFIAFDLFFKTPTGMDIDLSTNSKVTPYNEASKGMENAARVAFVVQGNVPDGSPTATIQGLKSATDSTRYIWEPNYDVHTAAAVANAANPYGITTTETGGSVLPYVGIKAPIPSTAAQPLNSTSATYFASVTPTYTTIKDASANTQIFSLGAGITKVRIYMWIEGQDVDCENNASGSNIQYDLQIVQHQ